MLRTNLISINKKPLNRGERRENQKKLNRGFLGLSNEFDFYPQRSARSLPTGVRDGIKRVLPPRPPRSQAKRAVKNAFSILPGLRAIRLRRSHGGIIAGEGP
jgi:hypothetical protein